MTSGCGWRDSRLEQDLHRAVLFLLEYLVGVRRLLERQPMGGEPFHPQGITGAPSKTA